MSKHSYMHLIGLSEEEVEKQLTEAGVRYRITSRDGEHFMVTCDYMPDRLNLGIEDGKVISISMG